MPDRKTFDSWPARSFSLLLGATAAFCSSGCDLEREQKKQEQRLVLGQPTVTVTSAPDKFIERRLLPVETAQKIKNSLAHVAISFLPEYQQYEFQDFSCSAFITRSKSGSPVLLTAQHCLPESLVSGEDGKVYSSSDGNGNSVLVLRAIDVDGKAYDTAIRSFYGETDANTSPPDAAGFSLFDPDGTISEGLPLSLVEPTDDDSYYIVRINSGYELVVSTVNFVRRSDNGMLVFLDTGAPQLSCVPGTSGSAIINASGEVVGLLDASAPLKLTDFDVITYKLSPDLLGADAHLCFATDAAGLNRLVEVLE